MIADVAEADEARGETATLLRALFESASHGIVVLDEAGNIALVNARAETMFGRSRNDLKGEPFEAVLADDARGTSVIDRVRAVSRSGDAVPGVALELIGQRKDGSRFPIEISLTRAQTLEGLRYVGFVTDISERKRVEEALRRSESQARAVLEAAGQAIIISDERGTMLSVNRQTEVIFGCTRRDLVGKSIEVLLPERLRARHVHHRATYFRDPHVRPMGRGLDLLARRADGSEFPVEISLSYVDTEEGTRALAFVTDISRRQAIERASRQTERLTSLGQLSAGLAHEVNNPIGVMTTRIELMLMDAEANKLPAEVVDDLKVLHRHAQRVAGITNSLLAFARQGPQEHRPVDLNEVVRAVLGLIGRQYERQEVRMHPELSPSLPPVFGQANALQQVVLNLVTNAAQAMLNGGDVTIATSCQDGRIRLVVADNGPGIPAEHLPHIFEPFFTTKTSGTGLGLSVTYGILNDHNATIDVDSRAGQGTRFVVSFPVAEGRP